MKKIIIFLMVVLFAGTAFAEDRVGVKGYTRRDGTYVAPHYRSSPDSSRSNNWSTKGNINPYTGEEGTKIIPQLYYPSFAPPPQDKTLETTGKALAEGMRQGYERGDGGYERRNESTYKHYTYVPTYKQERKNIWGQSIPDTFSEESEEDKAYAKLRHKLEAEATAEMALARAEVEADAEAARIKEARIKTELSPEGEAVWKTLSDSFKNETKPETKPEQVTVKGVQDAMHSQSSTIEDDMRFLSDFEAGLLPEIIDDRTEKEKGLDLIKKKYVIFKQKQQQGGK